MIMAEPAHSRKVVVHRAGSFNSSCFMIQSRPAKKLRRTASHLPAIQIKTGLHKSKSVQSFTLTNAGQDLSENWPCEVPQSAPPVMTPEPVFVWSSPKRNSQDVVFCDWPNGTASISPSSSKHQDGDCGIRMTSGNKQRSEKAPNPYNDTFKAQSSADGTTTSEDQTKWSRKPPHHLPPLDRSLFKTKSKSNKAVSSGEKKTKRCVNRPPEMESNNEMSSENDSKSANKTDDGFCSPSEKCELCDKQSSVTSRPIKQNPRPTCMYHSVDGDNDDLPCRGTLQKGQRIVPCKYETRLPRRRISISSSMEPLSSKKTGVDARAGISCGSSIQRSRAGLDPSLQSIASLPLTPETTSDGNSSNRFSIRRKVEVYSPSGTTHVCDRATVSRTRGRENVNVPHEATPVIPTEFQHSAGIATEESHVVGEFLPGDPQPGTSSLNYHAYWRVRKAGVCSQVQSATEEKERTQARVLMKKFGTLDIKKN